MGRRLAHTYLGPEPSVSPKQPSSNLCSKLFPHAPTTAVLEIRDMNGAAIATLMSEGANQLSKIKSLGFAGRSTVGEPMVQKAEVREPTKAKILQIFRGPANSEADSHVGKCWGLRSKTL